MRLREAKPLLLDILRADDWARRLGDVAAWPAKAACGALFSLILHQEQAVRMRAAEAFGVVLAEMAHSDMEGARVVMRGMLWRMNEESGGIGWGVPEAMACACARSPALAREYHAILLAYIHEHEGVCHGIFVDNPALRRGVLWGVWRLARARPELAAKAAPDLLAVLDPGRALEGRERSHEAPNLSDATARALACLALGELARAGQPLPDSTGKALSAWLNDATLVEIWHDDGLRTAQAGHVARDALDGLSHTPARLGSPRDFD